MKRLALFAAAGLLALGACTTVGPNYKVPEAAAVKAPAAQGPFLGAGSRAVSQDPLPPGWWRLYHDPTLDALEQQALAANTDLRVAAANLARAQAVVGEARAAGEPTVNVSGSVERARESGESFLLFEPIPPENLADVGLKVSYTIDLVGRLRRVAEAAQADAEASQAGLDLARVSVAGEVAAAYIDACAAGEELAVAGRTVELQARNLAVTERLTAAGRGTALDVTRARALVAQSRSSAPSLIARRQAALFRLAALTGKPPAEFPTAVADCAVPPKLDRPIPIGDGAALLRRRPDVRQADRTLTGATARIGVATAALYPTVTLGLGVGSTGLLADIGQPAANRWNAGSLISWTFPTGGERARIRQADAAADASLAKFDGVVLNALRETETALSAYAQDLQRNADLRAARDEAAVAEGQAQRLYRAGRSPYLTGLDATRTLAQADAALAASNSQVAADQVKLFLALGGGWEQAPPVTTVSRR
ncbi:MAG TPA: TolC family protein [Phenylobacterium sp.]|uniref:TolC family protein n=1 Tax=Phenylobacterium sp. TaxID=1871053 RepID=UPI002B470592|nr:TolC family protein [Phenylobacterium sp.]HKR89358.1 TolC family protein [Phenylobacterium sp.]